MDETRNEKGYALLLVMLMVVLFTIMGMGLLAMNMNAAKQFNIKEEQVQARHQAEMGVVHYERLLKQKVSSSSTTMLTCADIEGILGENQELADNQYKVSGTGVDKESCKPLLDEEKLEINVNSRGTISENTFKEVEATFFVENTGSREIEDSGTFPAPPNPPLGENQQPDESQIISDLEESCDNKGNKGNKGNNNDCANPTYTTEKFAHFSEFFIRKETNHFKDHLLVDDYLNTGPGSVSILKVNKNLFVNNYLHAQNHACIAVGGDLAIKNLLTYKNKNQTKIYVYGDFYLPLLPEPSTKYEFDFYVKGNVYEYNKNSQKYEPAIKSRFGIAEMSAATNKECDVVEYEKPINPKLGGPQWHVSEVANINYK